MPRRFGRIGIVALLLTAVLLGWRWQHPPTADPVIGRQLSAPGRAHLVNLFASWCVPCRAEMPVLVDLARSGIAIEGIAVRDTPAAVGAYLAAGSPYTAVRFDPGGRVQAALDTAGLPETYAVDADGRIRGRTRGVLTPGEAARLTAMIR